MLRQKPFKHMLPDSALDAITVEAAALNAESATAGNATAGETGGGSDLEDTDDEYADSPHFYRSMSGRLLEEVLLRTAEIHLS